MAEVIAAVETAHADISSGTAAQPSPVALSLNSSSASFLAMAALADRQGLAAVKLLADIPDNASAASAGAAVGAGARVARDRGFCEAIIHGQIPTRIRTAAASAVATRHLARPDSRVLGLIGAGDLAVEHVHALLASPTDRARARLVANPGHRRALHRTDRPRLPGLDGGSRGLAARGRRGSDVVCTLTPSREPIVEGAWFKPGLHVNAVGAPPRPDHREIDSAGMARARVFLDSMATAMHDSGDLLLAIADGAITASDVVAELGDVINGAAPGRTSPDDITLYNSVGIAMQDLAIGSLLLARAREKGVGLEIDLGA